MNEHSVFSHEGTQSHTPRDPPMPSGLAHAETAIGLASLPNELLLQIFRYIARDTPDIISRRCVQGTSACICCKHSRRYSTQKTVIGPPLIIRPDQAKHFLGYGLSRQLLPVVRDAIFLELRPVITLKVTVGFMSRQRFPHFENLLEDCIDLDRLKVSGWTDKLRNLRIEVAVSPRNRLVEADEVVDGALIHVANTASIFNGLTVLDVHIRGPRLDEIDGMREATAANLRGKLKKKKYGREIEVRLYFETSDLGVR